MGKKGIIIYRSKYGATKKYAGWLQEMTGFSCMENSREAWKEAGQYETIVLCGGIYASRIAGLSALKKNIDRYKDKEIFIFCVGASAYVERSFQEFREQNLTGSLKGIPVFYGRGMWDESKMTWPDRSLCKMLQKAVSKKDPSTYEPWMEGLLCAAGQVGDWTDKKYLAPLVECLPDRV